MRDPVRVRRFESGALFSALAYALVCLALLMWNSARLWARAEPLPDPWRELAQMSINWLAPEPLRDRLACLQAPLALDFDASEACHPRPGPAVAPPPPTPPAQMAPGSSGSTPPSTLPPSSPAGSSASPPSAANGARPSSSSIPDRSSIIFAGDSLANGYAAGGELALRESGSARPAVDAGRISTGLVNVSYHDWPAQARRLCSQKPAAFVFSFGSNDPMDLRDGGARHKFGSPEWIEAYAARAEAMVRIAHACGAKAAWVELPPMRDPSFESKMIPIRKAQARACSLADACLRPFSDLDDALTREFRSQTQVGSHLEPLRAADGVHMTPQGYLHVARLALRDLGLLGERAVAQQAKR